MTLWEDDPVDSVQGFVDIELLLFHALKNTLMRGACPVCSVGREFADG